MCYLQTLLEFKKCYNFDTEVLQVLLHVLLEYFKCNLSTASVI